MTDNFLDFLHRHQQRVGATLEHILPRGGEQTRLPDAMRYVALGQGKRLRPALVYASGEVLGVPTERLDAIAASVELIHAYSLVHDDLPAMDNDDLRRGQPTCHKKFDEATAILVGDALQSLAFQIIADPNLNLVDASVARKMAFCLAKAIGAEGMVLGQMQDLHTQMLPQTTDTLVAMHLNKTGALFKACIELAILAHVGPPHSKEFECLIKFGHWLGLAFQVHDDVLDELGETQTLGKQAGADKAIGKFTFTAFMGLNRAQAFAKTCQQKALDALAPLAHQSQILTEFADFFVKRAS